MKRRPKPDADQFKELADGTPRMTQLVGDFQRCVHQRGGNMFTRMRRSWHTLNNIWPGKSGDGRKHRNFYGTDVFPFEGASDVDCPLAQLYVREDKAFLMTLHSRQRMIVRGTEVGDAAFASKMTALLRWQIYSQMTEAWSEAQLLGDYFLSRPGGAVLAVFWETEQQLGYQTITLDQVQQVAAQAQAQLIEMDAPPPGLRLLADAVRLIQDPTRAAEAAEMIRKFIPDLEADEARRAVRELREQRQTQLVRASVSKNRPVMRALAPNEDVFIDPEAATLQDAADIHVVEFLSEAKLREAATTRQWGDQWIDAMLDRQRGVVHYAGLMGHQAQRARHMGWPVTGSRRFQVVHTFRRMADKNGVPGLFYTCWNPGLATHDGDELFAWHGLLGYDHGLYPFIHFTHDVHQRSIDAARSYPEIVATHQDQIKTQWDSRNDRTSLSTMPPLRHPTGKPPPEWGPGVQFGARAGEYEFLQPPRYDMGSQEVETSVRQFLDRYFGRVTPDAGDPVIGQTVRQFLGDCWMQGWQQAGTMILQLCQQLMPEEFQFRVLGSQKGRPMRATREEIQGKFDLQVTFNTAALDMEWLKTFGEVFQSAIALDTNGIVDRDEGLQILLEYFDAGVAERILKPGESAAAQESEDEALTVFPALMAGVDVPIKPGQAYALRLKTLDQVLMQPGVSDRVMRDELARERVEKRKQRLQHQIEQFTVNAFKGRQGG